MSGADSEEGTGDKPFEATQKKLEEARKKGEVPRSNDLIATAAYGGTLLAALLFGTFSIQLMGTSMLVLLDQADRLAPIMLGDGGAGAIGGALLARVGLGFLPWAIVPALCAVAAVLAQNSFTFTGSKISPKLSRLSLLSNFKQKFGRNGLFEFAKSFAKLSIYSIVLGVFLSTQIGDVIASAQLGSGPVILLLGQMMVQFMTVVVVVSLAIGAVDMLWQRAEHMRKNRMSHKEMTDEAKQTEGDPYLKQRRRQRGYDLATNRMMTDVPRADVVIVNPTHYAVALKWTRDSGSAPVCVAKGVDEIAARIRAAAVEAGVPVHSDPPAARALHATVAIGQEIGREHYKAVAAAIRFADGLRARKRAGG